LQIKNHKKIGKRFSQKSCCTVFILVIL